MYGLEVVLSLVDQLTGPLRGPMNALAGLERQAAVVENGVNKMLSGAGQVAAATALAAPFALATREAMKFESVMADVRKVVNFDSPAQFGEMRRDLMALSEEIPISAAGFAQIAAAAGQAGIARSEIVQFSGDAARMGVAFDLAAGDAGAAMTGLRTIFHLTQSDVVLLGDSVNQLSNNMDARASGIVDILSRVGATGRLVGLTGQQVAALGATFLALKTPPEVAATGINALLMKLATAPQQGKKFQNALDDIGLSSVTLSQNIKRDAQGALVDFLERVRGSKDVLGTLSSLFGAEYSDDVAKLVGNLDTYKSALGLVGDQAKYAGSMTNEFLIRSNTTENSMVLLRNVIRNVGITIGDILLPNVRAVTVEATKIIAKVREWADKNPKLAATLVEVAGATAGLLFLLGNSQIAFGGFQIGLGRMGAGLIRLQGIMAATRTSAIAMQAALMARVTMGVPSAAQAGQMASAWGRTTLALQGFGMAARAVGLALLTSPITWIVLAVVGLGAAFIYAWQHVEKFRDTVMLALVPIREGWASLKGSISSLLDSLGPVGTAIKGFFGQFSSVFDALAEGLGFFLGLIFTGVIALGSFVIGKLMDLFGGIIDVVTGAINWITGFVTGDTEKMKLGVSQILQGLQRIWDAIFGWMVDVVRKFGPKALAWIQSGLNAAANWMAGLVNSWRQIGANLVGGLVDGIKSKIGAATAAIQGVGNGVLNKFKGLLGIQSPSRVFRQMGGHLAQGLSLGITGGLGLAVGATERLAAGVMGVGMGGLNAPGMTVPLSAPAGGSPARSGGAATASGSARPSITIQSLTVQANNADEFMASMQAFVEAHR